MAKNNLCCPSTQIVDFAYEVGNPLRIGDYSSIGMSYYSDDEYGANEVEYESQDTDDEDDENGSQLDSAIGLRAVALFDFTPENDNEVELKAGQYVWISYRHGQGWLVAQNPETGQNGLVPEGYVELILEIEQEEEPRPFMPEILGGLDTENDNEWVDTEEESDADASKSTEKKAAISDGPDVLSANLKTLQLS